MSDQYREISHTSYFGNLKNALLGFIFGLALFVGSFFLISWNEGNSVKTHQALNWAQAQTVSAAPQPLDRSLEGRVVYVTGATTTATPIADTYFAVSAPNTLRLKRHVEMYQWVETKNTRDSNSYDGGTDRVTTYNYKMEWSDRAIKSAEFHIPANHANPIMPVSSETFNSSDARLGDYHLTSAVLLELNDFSQTVQPKEHDDYHVIAEQLYKGTSPDSPKIGDVRVNFTAIPADVISVIGQQSGNTIKTAMGPSGRGVLLAGMGEQSAESLYAHAHEQARMLTWILRFVGFIIMYIGVALLLNPLKALAAIIPFARPILGLGISIVSAVIALSLTSITIAIAWLAYRPLFAAAIAGGGLLLAAALYAHRHKAVASTAQASVVQRQ